MTAVVMELLRTIKLSFSLKGSLEIQLKFGVEGYEFIFMNQTKKSLVVVVVVD